MTAMRNIGPACGEAGAPTAVLIVDSTVEVAAQRERRALGWDAPEEVACGTELINLGAAIGARAEVAINACPNIELELTVDV